MLIEIENAIIDRLETGGLSVRDIDIKKGTKGLIYPAIFVSTNAGEHIRLGQAKYKCSPLIAVVAVFKHHGGEKERRHGVYPILEGIMLRLMLQDMDLEITPLVPVRFRNVTDKALGEKGLMAYQIDFKTSFTVTRVDDEVAVDLLKIGLTYYLQDPEDDGVADAEDEISLTAEEPDPEIPAEIPFVFTFITLTANDTFTPPFEDTGTYDCIISWGDGSSDHITAYDDPALTHTYAKPGAYDISITGTIIGWSFNNGGDCAKYYETKSVGPLRLGNSSGYWYGCVNHVWTATDILDLTGTTVLSNAFNGNVALTSVTGINSWATSLIQYTTNMFFGCTNYNQDLSGLDVSSVESMLNMLRSTSFDQDISAWDIGSLTNAGSFLFFVTLSVANFNALILSWSPQALTGAYNFHGGNSKYTGGGAVEAARNVWVAKGWILTDAGPV